MKKARSPKNIRKGQKSKEQSAMEYLLTYGWAVLIIAVVIIVLFQLNVFAPKAYFDCLGQPSFLCQIPSMSTDGAVTINISYGAASYPITITGLYCNVTPSTKPPSVETTSITLDPGQQEQFVFQCPITNGKIGSNDEVLLWIYYNTSVTPGQRLQEEIGKGVLDVTYGGSLTWEVNEWTPASNSVGMFLGYSTAAASGVYGPRNGYLYWENASPSIYAVNSFTIPNLTTPNGFTGSISPPTGNNIWTYIWAKNYQETDINYVSKETASDSSFNPATQLSQLAFVINPSATTTELDAYWIRERAYPPDGIMPAQGTFPTPTGYNSVATLQNNHAPTGPNFQQKITFDPLSYSTYEASDLGNIRFFIGSHAGPANALYSWCESGCSKSSSSAIFWVKIPYGLASGSNSIDMEFVQPTSTEYGGYAGESPTQSVSNGGSYAQYDNGQSVFDFYDDFAGTSLSSQWSTLEGPTVSVNDGLQLSGGIAYGASITATITPANSITGNTVVDAYYDVLTTPSTTLQLLPYSDITNPVAGSIPTATTLLNTSTWESASYGSLAGWSYSTDYHNHDLYNGIETSLFPLHQLGEDSAPCTKPWASRGYSANTTVNMSGTYTFNIWTDDGTQIFYKLASGSTWGNVFGNTGSVWDGQPDTEYSDSITFSKGQYNLVVVYTDICDPAGLSVVQISPPPST